MMKIFYVIKWILGSLLFLLLLDLVVKPAVMAPNQKGYQDGTKLPEQRLLPETSPALNVEEENHALELNQISRKRVKRGGWNTRLHLEWDCGRTENYKGKHKSIWLNSCSCPSPSRLSCSLESCQINPLKDEWMKNCKRQVKAKCRKITESELDNTCTIASLR